MPPRTDAARVVAIDGPAASGKSTAARLVADRLGFRYIDTGAMYRAVTLAALRAGADLASDEALGRVARSVRLDFSPGAGGSDRRTLLDGEDVSEAIRTPELTAQVRHIARAPSVRAAMREQQRRLGLEVPSVMEGRDIGTVVFPDARWKFYLDATVEERALRRRRQLAEKGIAMSDDALRNEIVERDRTDLERAVAPLRRATDAVYVDTTRMAIDEVVDLIAKRVGGERG